LASCVDLLDMWADGAFGGGKDGAFAQRLLGRTTPEVVLRLDPVEVSSWHDTRRMNGS